MGTMQASREGGCGVVGLIEAKDRAQQTDMWRGSVDALWRCLLEVKIGVP